MHMIANKAHAFLLHVLYVCYHDHYAYNIGSRKNTDLLIYTLRGALPKWYRYVLQKCPCFEPFYSQFAYAKSQHSKLYFHTAYKIYSLRYHGYGIVTFHDNSSKIFCKVTWVMPKTNPSINVIKFRPWKSIRSICIY